MTCNFLGLGSVSDWLKQISSGARPIRSTTQSLEVTAIWRALVPQYTPFFSPSPLKYMNQLLAWQGKTFKKKERKRSSRQPGRLGASFRSVLKSTMITWETRDLWKVGNFLFTLRYFRCYLVISKPLSCPSIQYAIPWFFLRMKELTAYNRGSNLVPRGCRGPWERQIIGVIWTVASFYYCDQPISKRSNTTITHIHFLNFIWT